MKKIIFVILTILLVFALTASVAATETADTGIQDEQTVTEESGENSYLDSLIDKISTSSFWVTVASFLTAIVSILAVFKKHFGNISKLIRTKASAEELTALKNGLEQRFSETYPVRTQLSGNRSKTGVESEYLI